MLNHFSVSNIRAISNDPADINNSYQVAVVEQESDGSNKTRVFKIKISDEISVKINELASLLLSYNPTADTLEQARFIKLNKIQNDWIQMLGQGWESGQGRLGLTAEDVALLSGNFALAKESFSLGGPMPPLITKENNIINFGNIQELTMLMLQYGQARSQLSVEYSEKLKAVESATTIEELDLIQ